MMAPAQALCTTLLYGCTTGKVMLNLLEELPLMLVGTRVLNLLRLSDIIMLERACGSQKSHQLFLDLVTLCPPVQLPSCKHKDISCLEWFLRTRCNIKHLLIYNFLQKILLFRTSKWKISSSILNQM